MASHKKVLVWHLLKKSPLDSFTCQYLICLFWLRLLKKWGKSNSEYLVASDLLHSFQYGFQPGYGTDCSGDIGR